MTKVTFFNRLKANFGPKYYGGGGTSAGTSDITEIPTGMNGLPADSPPYTYVC